jgi:ABC-type lipoprotein export system ATPase subunit
VSARSGSGKTTLLNLAVGLTRPTGNPAAQAYYSVKAHSMDGQLR